MQLRYSFVMVILPQNIWGYLSQMKCIQTQLSLLFSFHSIWLHRKGNVTATITVELFNQTHHDNPLCERKPEYPA